jgi:hypothetical protein
LIWKGLSKKSRAFSIEKAPVFPDNLDALLMWVYLAVNTLNFIIKKNNWDTFSAACAPGFQAAASSMGQ